MRKNRFKIVALFICLIFLITGCGKIHSKNNGEKNKIEVSQENMLSEDGIVSKEVMEAISGENKIFSFKGIDSSKIEYTWFYNGKQVQNPIEQKLKVEFPKEDLENIKSEANNASVALKFKLENMQLAAPVQLSILLNEKWDADKILLCKYIDGKVQKMEEVKVESELNGDEEFTKLTFPVTETGDNYYLLGGKSQTATKDVKIEEEKKEDKDNIATEESKLKNKEEVAPKEKPEENSKSKHTCTISIECGTILDNWSNLNKNKAEFVPQDGWIMGSTTVEFNEGDTVYDVLTKACKESKILMEASYTPMYGSYYIEGINQLYEFDCGNLSGWMYRVNGWYPNYGCSKYEVSDGDNIEWKYTCDLGRDVGGYMGE